MADTETCLFLLLPEYSMLSVLSATEPLRVANSVLGYEAYQIVLISDGARSVEASNGRALVVDDQLATSLIPITREAHLFVCASFNPENHVRAETLAHLRRLNRLGTRITSIEAGVYLLGRAGLLDGRRACAHWMGRHFLSQIFQKTAFSDEMIVHDGRITTCAGGAFPMQLSLLQIARTHGGTVARAVASRLNFQGGVYAPTSPRPDRYADAPKRFLQLDKICDLMDMHIEMPLKIHEISARSGVSRRQLDRKFLAAFGVTARCYYFGLRLNKARYLLRRSDMSCHQIAGACGFSSYAHFYSSYLKQFAVAPSQDRDLPYEATGMFRTMDQVAGM